MGKHDDDDDDAGKSGGKDADEDLADGSLLMCVAVDADRHMFGDKSKDSELEQFILANIQDWREAVAGEEDGSGTSFAAAERWKDIHQDYIDMMEETLEALVKRNGGTYSIFLADAKNALAGGGGFLFEDEK